MDQCEQASIGAICNVMNREILGSNKNRAQWKLPTEKEKGESTKAKKINIKNCRGRIIMSKFDDIVDQCIVGDEKK